MAYCWIGDTTLMIVSLHDGIYYYFSMYLYMCVCNMCVCNCAQVEGDHDFLQLSSDTKDLDGILTIRIARVGMHMKLGYCVSVVV